jgi:hypothetical protein
MRKTAFTVSVLAGLLITGSAVGQSYTPPQQNRYNNNVTGPPIGPPQVGPPQSVYRWDYIGSGYSALGLETTPLSLNLRAPLSTGMPRATYGIRPDPPLVRNLYQDSYQPPFGLPGQTQGMTGYPSTFGQTRFLSPVGTPDQATSDTTRIYGRPVEPTSPVPINPVGPIRPTGEIPFGSQEQSGMSNTSMLLGLPRLPWEVPAEQQGGQVQQPPTGQPTGPLALPGPGQGGTQLLPGNEGTPFDLNLQGGPGNPNETKPRAPADSFLQPLGPLPENPAPTGATPTGDQPSAAVRASRQPVLTSERLETSAARHLKEAEAYLKAGQYARAADKYNLARVVAPKNPTPLLGRSVALLGNAEFTSSANNLLLAVDLNPDPAVFRVDINSLVPDRKLLDQRVAEIQDLIKRFEDFRLRFLLGYVEYCRGEETVGMIDMTQAAQHFPAERPAARRLLDALSRERISRMGATTAPASAR